MQSGDVFPLPVDDASRVQRVSGDFVSHDCSKWFTEGVKALNNMAAAGRSTATSYAKSQQPQNYIVASISADVVVCACSREAKLAVDEAAARRGAQSLFLGAA